MSLKAFHLVFILASIALSVWFGVWCLGDYSFTESPLTLAMGVGSFLSTIGMCFYLVWFLRKLSNIGFVALAFLSWALLSLPQSAHACAVCIGNPNSELVKSANTAVLFMLVIVGGILSGFAGLFVLWARREKSLKF